MKDRSVDLVVIEADAPEFSDVVRRCKMMLKDKGVVIGVGSGWHDFPGLFFQGKGSSFLIYGPSPCTYRHDLCSMSLDEIVGRCEMSDGVVMDLRTRESDCSVF